MESRDENDLPILRATYEFLTWLLPLVVKFPKDYKFVLGDRMQRELLLVHDLLVRARWQRDRGELLESAQRELEVLRFQIRLAKDLKCLSIKAYGTAAVRLTEIGRQLGGWRKHAHAHRLDDLPAPPPAVP